MITALIALMQPLSPVWFGAMLIGGALMAGACAWIIWPQWEKRKRGAIKKRDAMQELRDKTNYLNGQHQKRA
jgi:hypothetical protein